MTDGPTVTFGATERRRPTTTPLGGPRPVLDGAWIATFVAVLLLSAGALALLELALTS